MKVPTINQLFDSGVHIGHQVKRWHPSMGKYIYTAKNGIHIINLEKTVEKLEEATNYLHDVAKKGGKIIFVGTKKQSKDIIELEAKRCGAYYVTERWLGGTMTNLEIVRKSVKKLTDTKKGREAGEFDKYTKKERLLIDRGIEKLEKKVGGLVGLSAKPAALFIIDPKREKTAIREAKNLGVKVVSLIDTNTDTRDIDFLIPGNDDAIKSVAVIVKAIADSIEEGYNDYAKVLVSEDKAATEKKAEKSVEEVKKVEPKKEVKEELKETKKEVEKNKETTEVKKVKKTEKPVSKKVASKSTKKEKK